MRRCKRCEGPSLGRPGGELRCLSCLQHGALPVTLLSLCWVLACLSCCRARAMQERTPVGCRRVRREQEAKLHLRGGEIVARSGMKRRKRRTGGAVLRELSGDHGMLTWTLAGICPPAPPAPPARAVK
mmetsp:Transcript_12257/g.42706  ORF Transcript_12257/g.42706 Transcript_12257/m.42706 type:complete len:128 (-) Transcript_12257:682-1065(-)